MKVFKITLVKLFSLSFIFVSACTPYHKQDKLNQNAYEASIVENPSQGDPNTCLLELSNQYICKNIGTHEPKLNFNKISWTLETNGASLQDACNSKQNFPFLEAVYTPRQQFTNNTMTKTMDFLVCNYHTTASSNTTLSLTTNLNASLHKWNQVKDTPSWSCQTLPILQGNTLICNQTAHQ